jgi:hypothetical protein
LGISSYVNGLFEGTAADMFSPNTNMTRGIIVTVLWRLAGRPGGGGSEFDDVDKNAWHADAIAWTREKGIVTGIGGSRFDPDTPVSRQDLAVIISRFAVAMGWPIPVTRDYAGFKDDADCANYAKDAIEAFFRAGIINGYPDGSFKPQGTATRAEVAAMLHRFIEAVKPKL